MALAAADSPSERGWALIRTEDYARAESDFAKALELAPGDPHATAGLEQAREYRVHPAYAAREDGKAATGLSFDKFRRIGVFEEAV